MTLIKDNEEERRLQAKLNECASSFMDKKNILDARDKLLRFKQDRQTDLAKAVALVGTCLDMCPEQERYFRIETNKVSPFETHFSNNISNGVPDERRMVKEYRRSGADQEEPLPHELRPIEVLERTMDYLCFEIIDRYDTHSNIGEWYDFVWSRTRSIRKDITQQHLVDLKSVALIEKCARFHIFCSYYLCEEEIKDFDPKINEENLSNCLQTLKDFYYDLSIRSIHCPNEAEFRAYDILLNIGHGETLSELKHFRSEIKNSKDVLLAIKLYQFYDSKNHYKFFKYARQVDFFKSCILNRYFNSFRINSLNIQRKAYTVSKSSNLVPYPVEKIIDLLAFDDFKELSYFCDYVGLKYDEEYIYFQRTFIIENVNLKKRSNLVLKKLTSSPGKAIIGLKNFEQPRQDLILPVHSSFDNNNKLIYDKNNFQINNLNFITTANNFSKPKKTDFSFLKSISNTFDNYNVTNFNFKSQFDKISSEEEKPVFETFKNEPKIVSLSFNSELFKNTNLVTQNEPVKNEITKPQKVIDRRKIINEIKFDIFDSLLKVNIQEHCRRTFFYMQLCKQIIAEESKNLMNSIISECTLKIIKENWIKEKRTKVLNKSSNELFQSILMNIIEFRIKEIYSEIKLKRQKEILSFSKIFYEEILEKILASLTEKILLNEIKLQDERIKKWRHNSLQIKYWSKWRRYYLLRKRYKFYRETFPATPYKIARSMDRECPYLYLNNSTFIDDNFIKTYGSLKRKLVYSRYNDIAETKRFIDENLRNNDKFSIKLSKSILTNGIEIMEREIFLEKKYFKLWLNKVRQRKHERICLEFPSAPYSTNKNFSKPIDMMDDKNNLTIIDTVILNANDSIKRNLFQKLNYDFDSTVALIKKTLDNRRKQRQREKELQRNEFNAI